MVEVQDIFALHGEEFRQTHKLSTVQHKAMEFIRRLLMHVLPQGFMKIRHFGFLSSRGKQVKLKRCQQLTHTKHLPKRRSTMEILVKILGRKPSQCPCCGFDGLQQLGLSPP